MMFRIFALTAFFLFHATSAIAKDKSPTLDETVNYLNEKIGNSRIAIYLYGNSGSFNKGGIFKRDGISVDVTKTKSIEIYKENGADFYSVKIFCSQCVVHTVNDNSYRYDFFEFGLNTFDDAARFKKALEHLLRLKTGRKELF